MSHRHLVPWPTEASLRPVQLVASATPHPLIDVHNHLGRWLTDGSWMIDDVPRLIAMMDAQSVELIVNLDGLWGDELSANIARYDLAHPGRFATFCQLDWALLPERGGVDQVIAQLDDCVSRGARGLRIWKNLGQSVRERGPFGAEGPHILQDDPRVVEIVRLAGEHGLPVLVHTTDQAPGGDFGPLSPVRPLWGMEPDCVPHPEILLDAHARLVEACPDVTFIGSHVGCSAHDLDRVETLLERAGNYHVEISGRMAELGRQSQRFAALVSRFPDRVLFGTDRFPHSARIYSGYRRFLERVAPVHDDPTSDQPVRYRRPVPGLGLDPALLPALYHTNAAQILGLAAGGQTRIRDAAGGQTRIRAAS